MAYLGCVLGGMAAGVLLACRMFWVMQNDFISLFSKSPEE